MWEEQIKKNFGDRMGARLSTYNNTPKTKEIRKKLKELRKKMLDAFDRAGNNTGLELYEPLLPKVESLLREFELTHDRQMNETMRQVRERRDRLNAEYRANR